MKQTFTLLTALLLTTAALAEPHGLQVKDNCFIKDGRVGAVAPARGRTEGRMWSKSAYFKKWAAYFTGLSSLALVMHGQTPTPPKTPTDQVALLISPDVYRALKSDIQVYKADVEARFPAQLHIVEGRWRRPDEVRATIKSLYAEKKIAGVILVGALPMHHFFMHENPNPNPLYYEDFNLEFIDRDKDGVDDVYKGKVQMKIWVANIRSSEKARENDIPGLRRFFAKTHDYYTGKVVPELRTLILSSEPASSDWAGCGDWFMRKGAARFSAPSDVTLLEGKACTHKNLLKAFKQHSYSLTCLALHSDQTGHGLFDEDIMAHELAELKTGSLITISHACFAANWTKNERDNNGPNCALSWVFGKHLGQTIIGNVRSGGAGYDNFIYDGMRAGDYIGKAYIPCKQADEDEASKGDHVPGDVVSGVLLIGNPFLKLNPVKRDTPGKVRLVIRKAVYGDLANNSVVDVTQKVADWIEESLKITANNDDFGDPAEGIEKQLKVDYTLDGVETSKIVNENETLKIWPAQRQVTRPENHNLKPIQTVKSRTQGRNEKSTRVVNPSSSHTSLDP